MTENGTVSLVNASDSRYISSVSESPEVTQGRTRKEIVTGGAAILLGIHGGITALFAATPSEAHASLRRDEIPGSFTRNQLNLSRAICQQEPWSTFRMFAEDAKDQRIWNPTQVFGVSADRLVELDAAITLSVIAEDFDYAPKKFKVDSLAAKIKEAALKLGIKEHIEPDSSLAQRVIAAGVNSWVRTHLSYNNALVDPKAQPYSVRALYWTSETLLQQKQCFAVCAGIGRLTHDLSVAAGLSSRLMLGVVRDYGNQIPASFTHIWAQHEFSSKDGGASFLCPSDNTIGRINLKRARELKGKIHSPCCLPAYPMDWGYYLWREHALGVDGISEKSVPENLKLQRCTEQEWRQVDRCGPESLLAKMEENMAGATVDIKPL